MRFRKALLSLSMAVLASSPAWCQETTATTPDLDTWVPAEIVHPMGNGQQVRHLELASCSFCLPSSIPKGPIQALLLPGFQAGVDHQFTPLKTLTLNGHEVANPADEKINSNTTQLHLQYNVDDRFGFQVSIPYHDRNYRRQTASGVESGSVSGLGDIVVRGRYAPVARFKANSTLVWTVDAGIKLPTGNSSLLRQHDHGADGHSHGEEAAEETPSHHDRNYLAHEGHEHEPEEPAAVPEESHEEHEHEEEPHGEHEHSPATAPPSYNSAVEGHDLVLGTGSVDGVLGTGVLYRTGSFYASAGGQYLLRSTGTAGYRFGDMLTWSVSPGYLFINEATQVVGLQLNVSGEHHDPNYQYGSRDHGYTDVVYAGPEIVSQGENLSLNLGLDLPVKYHSEGFTLAPDYRARVHFNYRF